MYGLDVHAAVLQALLREPGDRSHNYRTVLDMKFPYRVLAEAGLCKTFLIECIPVDEDHRRALQPPGIGLECRRIHRHQKVTEIPGSCDMSASDMHLKSGNTRKSPVRSPYFSRKIGESGKFVAVDCRHVSKKRSGELHSVTRISGKSYHNIFSIYYFVLHE